ncbi:MAG TPA: formylglycine-generating enzyme family protein [Cryomorphaceae bacterium]|nr:formylglycine-generating enzyme family protein [Cryomorphaceae bacterium]
MLRFLIQVSIGICIVSCSSRTTVKAPAGMIWVPAATFIQGAQENDMMAQPHEKPAHKVKVNGFFMDEREVTNARFREFVEATSYTTVAERPVDWEELKQQLPPGTPRPADSLLLPGSLVFRKQLAEVQDHHNIWQWWEWKIGANWRHPAGPESDIFGKDNYPVVHIAYEDAVAYCRWKGHRLPTEAEWERATHGEKLLSVFTWGNDPTELPAKANTWQGEFPTRNLASDGFAYAAPVGSFPPNSIGLYDMAGNVWEWTSDWYNHDYYYQVAGEEIPNPQGAKEAFNPLNPYQKEKIIKGGSFLCHESYCASFRISARMAMAIDSGSDHLGFRTVKDAD